MNRFKPGLTVAVRPDLLRYFPDERKRDRRTIIAFGLSEKYGSGIWITTVFKSKCPNCGKRDENVSKRYDSNWFMLKRSK